ncbi:nucleoside triphosphate pyrophosphohydrolase [Nocardiopsis composta]|uniref:Putative house-cleaning noncanonical NTP pyrophosphatase (MazG superfamily) n=1 Tax=Nocardiopsis composta TaxID=157465 RepID=A0A7W8QN56_9ACTN|nr:nucleoside triphosphate pyrophosphohydrolase [Nocardiopsis composta]MBB5432855.1 putative house-cleaning noncanonical NTP pyrophosphatase (MazG superfamily) [Nocardiopsis composta]
MQRKLVRDRIPEIITADGLDPVITVAGQDEYERELRRKLTEEVSEYRSAGPAEAVEELADVLEVVYALARVHGADAAELDRVRRAKAEERGAFDRRLIWHGNR